MKTITLFACLLAFAATYAQSGVYLSVDDYLSGKLTDECQSLSVPRKPGENDLIVLLTKNGRKTYKFSQVWGYKDGLSEYRMIQSLPYLIVCKGEILAFAPYGPIRQVGKKVVYYRRQLNFGEIVVTKNMRDPDPITLSDFTQLWQAVDSNSVPDLKKEYSKLVVSNEGVYVVPEQIINYYNSTRPGYVPPIYTHIEVLNFKD